MDWNFFGKKTVLLANTIMFSFPNMFLFGKNPQNIRGKKYVLKYFLLLCVKMVRVFENTPVV